MIPKAKYYINGEQVTADAARQHWVNSKSYANANTRTRCHIWRDAHESDGGKWGEINWLNEAGITLVLEAQP